MADGTSLNTVTKEGITTIASNVATTAAKLNNSLDKEAFLQLLVKQMQYQDPLDPQDNSEYVAQLAQFSSLEQMTNVSDAMSKVNNMISTMNSSMLVGQASSFVGKTVTWDSTPTATSNTEETPTPTFSSGKVDAVKIVDGQPYLVIGKNNVDISKVAIIS